MSSSAIINLDWRTAPESREILNAIEGLFAEADNSGEVKTIFSQSKAKGIIKLELYDLTVVDNHYFRQYFLTKLQENCPGRVAIEEEAPMAETQVNRPPSQSPARDLSAGARAIRAFAELARSAP